MAFYHSNRKITDTPADREASSGCQTKVTDSLGQGLVPGPTQKMVGIETGQSFKDSGVIFRWVGWRSFLLRNVQRCRKPLLRVAIRGRDFLGSVYGRGPVRGAWL